MVAEIMRTRMALAARLVHLRNARGWTQEQAAEAAGLNVRQVIRCEAGAVSPSLTTLVALAVAYGVRVGDLFERS
jgi:transcriptional regulator with XRE-family HTH domain